MELHDLDDSGPANNANKRPPNAFLLFCKRHRGIVKEKYPTLENRNITKILGEWWQSLGEEEKADFNDLATEYKEFVMREQPNFRWRKPPSSTVTNPHFTKSQKVPPEPVAEPEASQTPPSSTPVSNGNSGSSSPEPSPAPKPFKKRYLQEQQARKDPSSIAGSVSPDAEDACKALLELAGVRESSPPEQRSGSGSRSGTSSPPGEGQLPRNKVQGFDSLRDAVWNRVARDLLKLEEEKGNGTAESEDGPLNLSSQCTIRGQTIIEHIIENILPKGEQEAEHKAISSLNNNGRVNGELHDETAEELKQRIYQGLKEDILNRAPDAKIKDRSALWKLLPQNNIAPPKSFPVPKPSADSTPSKPEPVTVTPAPGSLPPPSKPAKKEKEEVKPTPERQDDGTKLDIKNLLAQSPSPQSPRSKSSKTCPSTASLVAAVLEQEQPVELFMTNPPPPRRQPPPVSVTLVSSDRKTSPLNLTTGSSQQQQPAVTLTPVTITPTLSTSPAKRKASSMSEDDDDDIRRSSRSCKGRRYQEFKDEGRLGKRSSSGGRRSHKSGDTTDTDPASASSSPTKPAVEIEPLVPESKQSQSSTSSDAKCSNSTNTQQQQPFDVSARLNAIPALSLEAYQQKVRKSQTAPSHPNSSSSSSHNGTARRPSVDASNPNGGPKRKTRRTTVSTTTSASTASSGSPSKNHTSAAAMIVSSQS